MNELLCSKSGGRGLKSIIFSKNKRKGELNKATYATVCKSMQHIPTINAVLNEDGGKLRNAIGLDSVHNKGLMYVMLYELLFSKYGSIRGGGKLKRMIIKHEAALREGIAAYIAEHGADIGEAKVNFPRYVRVNVAQTSADEMIKMLHETLANNVKVDPEAEELSKVKVSIFADPHVPDLLVLHPSASSFLHQDHTAVKSGKVVLQDKSSCFSALVLAQGNSNAPINCDFIDACAAPGNKTTHLAALVSAFYNDAPKPKKKKGKKTDKPNSTIFAFERSSVRHKVLKSRVDTLTPSSEKVVVEPLLGDFLKSDPNDPQFTNVKGILLDPSCSGSGIVNSPDRWLEDAEADDTSAAYEDKAKRIQSLANFQLVALKHAMSFPSVDRIVYSTCSVHDEENEVVVGKALAEVNLSSEGPDGDEWQLVSPVCLRHWPRRGKAGGIGGLSESQASCLIRCDGLDGDETNGFFVSYFERKKAANEDESKAASTSINSHDLPVYKGQFADIIDKTKEAARTKTIGKSKKKKENSNIAKNTQSSTSKQKQQPESDKSQEKIAKKKAKKLAWKQKQALQKAQRLKEKKDKSSVDNVK